MNNVKSEERKCEQCKRPFETINGRGRFCSGACRAKHHRDSQKQDEEILDFGKYTWNKKTDKYIFPLKSKLHKHGQPLVIRGEDIRALCADYSDENGTPATINELAKKFSLPKEIVQEILRRLDRTHEQEGFTKEEVLTLSPEELIERTYQQKRAALAHQREIADWKQVVEKANKWDKMDVFVTDEFRRLLQEKPYHPKRHSFARPERDYAALLGISDLHYGKHASEEESYDSYNVEKTRDRIITHATDVLSNLRVYGKPEKIIIPVGSDFFHVDTYNGTTTKGTPQDVSGTPSEIMRNGALLMREVVDLCREITDVQLVMLEGNHDRLVGRMLFMYLEAVYENCEDVEVNKDFRPQTFLRYGKNLLGFAHGDGVKKVQDLAGLMAMIRDKDWAECPYRTFYTGNYHYEKVETDEFFSVVKRQMPSLSGSDRWLSVNGYVNLRKSLPLYLHDAESGPFGIFYSSEEA